MRKLTLLAAATLAVVTMTGCGPEDEIPASGEVTDGVLYCQNVTECDPLGPVAVIVVPDVPREYTGERVLSA